MCGVTVSGLTVGTITQASATRQIRKLHPKTQVIVVTSHHQDEYIFPAVRAMRLRIVLRDQDLQGA